MVKYFVPDVGCIAVNAGGVSLQHGASTVRTLDCVSYPAVHGTIPRNRPTIKSFAAASCPYTLASMPRAESSVCWMVWKSSSQWALRQAKGGIWVGFTEDCGTPRYQDFDLVLHPGVLEIIQFL